MEIEKLIEKMKEICLILLDYIETSSDSNDEFTNFIEDLVKLDFFQNETEFQLLFRLILKIVDNYHRNPLFFQKIDRIINYLCKDRPSLITSTITNYNDCNKRELLFLLKNGFVNFDQSLLNQKSNQYPRNYYLYPGMKQFIDKKLQKEIEDEIYDIFDEEISTFEEKCQIGENDSYVCSLIREDSVEEFISYVTRTNLSLTSIIKPSIYETNSFLIDKEPSLIEYAAFFGSIQIIQYLQFNNVPLTFSLWMYSIHSNNPELIHFLEDNVKIKYDWKTEYFKKFISDDVFSESIKCHHYNISYYIRDNLRIHDQTNDSSELNDSFDSVILNSLNFFYFPNEIGSIISKSKNEMGFNIQELYFSLTKITIPSSVTSIGNCAFKNCSSLKEIIIPSSVTEIGNGAFSDCSSLTQITIPSSVTEIGNSAFSNCSSLEQITIPSSITSIKNGCFRGCTSLRQISMQSSITSIGFSAFFECSSLKEIVIPPSVKEIGDNSFNKCSLLTQITIPLSITKIGNYLFYGCSSLTQITIPTSVTEIGDGAFSDCTSLTQITIPTSVTKIGDGAFCNCTSLSQVSIPSSVTSISNGTFKNCTLLTQITIPVSIIKIEDHAFEGCTSLKKISILSSTISIGDHAFEGCPLITQIPIHSVMIDNIESLNF